MFEKLTLKYGKYVTICHDDKISPNIIEAYSNENSYIIKYKNETYFTVSAIQIIIELIGKERKYDECVYAMHGAAIEKSEKAYLFLAPTGTGKTTLVAYLSLHGFGYITDDCILVNKNDLNVFPYSSPIQLRLGGFEVIKSSFPNFNLEFKPVFDRYALLPTNYVEKNLPIGEIFFINRTDVNELKELTSIEKYQLLLKSSLTAYKFNADILRFVSKLSKIKCSELKYKDLDFVLGVLKNEL